MVDHLPEALALEANPTTQRLRAPLAELLRLVLPRRGLVLEIGSGNGEQIVYFAGRYPHLRWQPSDPAPDRRLVIERWIATTSSENVLAPVDLDVCAEAWPVQGVDAVVCCNLLHAAPVTAIAGLMAGAARVLPARGRMLLCGLFGRGRDSNRVRDYDRRLRAHDRTWGVRSIDQVLEGARAHGLRLEDARELPGEHVALVLERGRSA